MSSWSQFLSPTTVRYLGVVTAGTVTFAMANYFVSVSIPAIVEDIGGVRWISWLASLFTGGAILATASAPALINRLSGRGAIILGTAFYLLGALLCGLAPSMPLFLLGRVLLGIGAGLAFGFGAVFIRRIFTQEQWPKAFGALSVAFGGSAVLGPLIGGWFAEAGYWRISFAVLAGFGLIYLVLGLAYLPRGFEDPEGNRSLPMRRLALFGGAVLLLSTSNQVPPILSAAAVIAAFAAFWLFLRLDGGRSDALLPSKPFSPGRVLSAGYSFVIVISAATIAFFTYGTFLMVQVFGLTAIQAGYVAILETFGWSITATIVAGMSDRRADPLMRIGPWVVVAGTVAIAAGMGLSSLPLVIVGAYASGMGMGMSYSNISRCIVLDAPDQERDVAASAMVTIQQLGFVVGAALSGLIANSLGLEALTDPQAIRSVGFWLIAAFVPLAFFAAWQVRRLRLPV